MQHILDTVERTRRKITRKQKIQKFAKISHNAKVNSLIATVDFGINDKK